MSDHSNSNKSWSFISETSFSGLSDDTSLDLLDLITRDSNEKQSVKNEGDDLATDMMRFHERMMSRERQRTRTVSSSAHSSTYALSVPRKLSTMSYTSNDEREPSILCVSRTSSQPIQLLEDPYFRRQQNLQSNSGSGFFNHMLYGSLRHGDGVNLFSSQYLGLLVTSVITGFMTPFLDRCFHPLLSVYLGFNIQQAQATQRVLFLPGVLCFFIGIISDFYPLWCFHRKSYMLGGWVVAYLNLMALVVIVMYDDRTELLDSNVRTFYGGIVYILLEFGFTFGSMAASIISLAYVVEISQRELIHDRGRVMMEYLIVKEIGAVIASIATACLMETDSTTGRLRNVVSLKILVLLMALITLLPIPAVLFRLEEEKREINVDSVDRTSLAAHLWNIIQQCAVWRIILFMAASFFLSLFTFPDVEIALDKWSHVTPGSKRIGQIPIQIMVLLIMYVYRNALLNYNWRRGCVMSLMWYVGVQLVASIPVLLHIVHSPWYYLSILSFTGISYGFFVAITTLPIIEITETGIEGATAGLVTSYYFLIHSVVQTFCEGISTTTMHGPDYSSPVPTLNVSQTRGQVFGFVIGQAAINLLALLPIMYLLPRQKLEAQQMRAYDGYSRSAGIAITVLFAVLLVYVITSNVLGLLKKY